MTKRCHYSNVPAVHDNFHLEMSQVNTTKKAASSLQEVQETIRRISEKKSVQSVMIVTAHGDIIQSTWDPEEQLKHAKAISNIVRQARFILQENDPLSLITVRSLQREIIVAPDGDYLLVVLQNAPHMTE
jgi:dynein light chain roadblock-type